MTRETRISLLVAVAFIIMFGLVLGVLNEPPKESPQPVELVGESGGGLMLSPIRSLADEAIELSALRPVPVTDRDSVVEVFMPRESQIGGGVVRSEMPRRETLVAHSPTPAPVYHTPAPVAPTPAPVVQPPPPARLRTYKVQPNDSLYKIAVKVYGNGGKYLKILDANRDTLPDEDMLRVGQKLVIPDLSERPARSVVRRNDRLRRSGVQELRTEELPRFFAEQSGRSGSVTPSVVASRTYVVRPGDNLTKIAKRTLNDGSYQAVQRLYRANVDRIGDPDVVPVGLELVVPI